MAVWSGLVVVMRISGVLWLSILRRRVLPWCWCQLRRRAWKWSWVRWGAKSIFSGTVGDFSRRAATISEGLRMAGPERPKWVKRRSPGDFRVSIFEFRLRGDCDGDFDVVDGEALEVFGPLFFGEESDDGGAGGDEGVAEGLGDAVAVAGGAHALVGHAADGEDEGGGGVGFVGGGSKAEMNRRGHRGHRGGGCCFGRRLCVLCELCGWHVVGVDSGHCGDGAGGAGVDGDVEIADAVEEGVDDGFGLVGVGVDFAAGLDVGGDAAGGEEIAEGLVVEVVEGGGEEAAVFAELGDEEVA